MLKAKKKIIILTGVVFFFSALGFAALLFRIKSYDVFGGGAGKLTDKKMYIFAPPSIAESMVDSIKKYGLRSNTRASLIIVPEKDLEAEVASSEEVDAPLAFVGYSLKEEDENEARVFSKENMLGVTNDFLFDKCRDVKCDIVVSNLCQLRRLAKKKDLNFFLSENFLPIRNRIEEVYRDDCKKFCSGIAKKIKMQNDSVLPSESEGPQRVFLSREIMPELLLSGSFVQREFFGVFVYFELNAAKGSMPEIENNSSAFLDYISLDDVAVFVKSGFRADLEEVRGVFTDACERELNDFSFDIQAITPRSFFDKKGILFGLESDISNFGSLVYKSSEKFPIWGYCRNDSDAVCQGFLGLASRVKG